MRSDRFAALTVLAAGLIGPLATPAAADGLRPEWVSADAQWLVHLDVRALRESTLGAFILEHADALDIDLQGVDEMEAMLDFDPRTDLYSVTAYGNKANPETGGVLIAETNHKAEAAIERLMEMDEVEMSVIDVGGRRVHAVTGADGEHLIHLRPGRRARRVLVMGDDRGAMAAALDVLDGRADGLSMGTSKLLARSPRESSILFIAASDVSAMEQVEHASEIARYSDSVTIDVGEAEDEVYARAAIGTASRDDAANIAQIVQGMIALGRLLAGNDADFVPLHEVLASVNIRADGPQILLQVRYETEPLIHYLREAVESDGWDEGGEGADGGGDEGGHR